MLEPQSITNLANSPEHDRKVRMLRYTVAMTIRIICIVLAMLVQGWLMWLFFAGAIFLPYFAVVLANGQVGTKTKTATAATAPTLSIGADAFTSAPAPDTKPND
ncbi:DUF3099 domain-containing protein [Rhodoluna sp.]|uniref:DUF3099 domain-containing protein n=1 Tax=Rhodoluna sp. TaxID=1969481 RepID=UPI0025FC3559|nr:DUF3099 domain-containing protein [Rhodoluna sp.]